MEQSNPPPKKQEIAVIEESKGEKATAIAQIEEWGNWKPPQISTENENLQINVGLRQTRQRASRQRSKSQTQQEDKNETCKPFKKKIPGAYHEEDEAEEEIRVLIPTKYKKTQEGKEKDNDYIEIISRDKNKKGLRQESQKMESKDKVTSTANNPKLIDEHVMKKILEQKMNLTIEEIISISSTFIDKLQNLTTQEKEVIKSVNMSNIQERLLSLELHDYDTPRLHYAFPLGFMEVFIGREEYPTMDLVNTGSGNNIIPEEIEIKASLTSRKLNMNLRGIGGHTTSLVGLSEFKPITMTTGGENYPEQDGHQLCLPICNPQAMGWQISPPRGMELCEYSEIGKWSINQAESSKRKETEETESQSSTRVKTIFLGPNKIPFSAIFDAKNDLNVITQEIALKAELNTSPYTSKSTENSLKLIGQIQNLEVTFESEEKTYLDFLVFENFNQIIIEEKSSILSSSKESMPAVTHIKSKGKETEYKLEVEYSEAIEKIKEELKKMRRNLDIAIEDPEEWLALELIGMNKKDKVESPQKKFKLDLKPPEANSSGISEDYFNLFQEEAW
ncbi:hypothetical protein O181_054350 [Austropuccinia psidii MF-1]|uniref:Uncharacterized protein n=1 Tax=Austropuccinia psidii MF-1 TaxID=1389203 RepID=A0A9Q3E2A9_9BASI|nr:hypothetical protein [Austropuccinia psidii MF-1]